MLPMRLFSASRVNGRLRTKATLLMTTDNDDQRRRFSVSQAVRKIENVLIIGGGFMGSGIAQSCALSGRFQSITIQENVAEQVEKSKASIRKSLDILKRKNRVPAELIADTETVAARIAHTSDPHLKANSFGENLLVIEAITEVLTLKHALFKDLATRFSDHPSVLFATNTSSLKVTDIARALPENRSNIRGRFAGLHFLDAILSPVVEIARTEWTSEETLTSLQEFATCIGKRPILCKDIEGFIANRLVIPLLWEALRMVDRGDASVEDIDAAMKLGYHHPLGPFELLDFIGLDLIKAIMDSWPDKTNSGQFSRSPTIEKLIAEGRLGRKTGRGFYDYGGGKKDGGKS